MPTQTAPRRVTRRTASARRVLTMFRPQIRSRHPSHQILRTDLPRLPFKSVVRLGSTTDLPDTITNGGRRIECNTVEAISNTSDKVKMKTLFMRNNIKSPKHTAAVVNGTPLTIEQIEALVKYPIIAKIRNHSRGRGMVKLADRAALTAFLSEKASTLSNYTFEQFMNMHKEYRIHATEDGIFYACRKLRRDDTPEADRWFFNSTNCNFKIVTPELEPANWQTISAELVKALKALKMDIAGFDVRVNREANDFTIIEANSACSFGTITGQKYMEEIPKILKRKHAALQTA